jgi:hypothetical protein
MPCESTFTGFFLALKGNGNARDFRALEIALAFALTFTDAFRILRSGKGQQGGKERS